VDRIPKTPPAIAPLPPDTVRPYWSVMIPAYNCSDFLPDAIQSVLQQDPGPELMQIEVVDDCSTDADVEALVKKIGNGRVLYYRQDKNSGSLRNFETCINRAKGHYVHLLHGDDRVKPGFYTSLKGLFEDYPEAGAAFGAYNFIDTNGKVLGPPRIIAKEAGILENALLRLAEENLLEYVTVAVKREVYEKLGSFYALTCGEDWIMWARIARKYPIAYTPQIIAEYRHHDNSITSQIYFSGQNIRDIKKVIDIVNSYLPEEKQGKSIRAARKKYAYNELLANNFLWRVHHNKHAIYNQVKEILKLYIDSKALKMALKLLLKINIEPYRRYLKL
jgi:glycosyltransferase involved in cell wall biosynthesis